MDIWPGILVGTQQPFPLNSVADGQYIKRNGSAFDGGTPAGGGGGLTITGTKTANYTAVDGDHVICDSNGAAGDFTVTLPASPSNGNQVRVTLITDHATRIVDIGRNASNLNGSTDETVWRLVQEGDTVLFTYVGGDTGWLVEDGIRAAVAKMVRTTDQTIAAGYDQVELTTSDKAQGITVDEVTNWRATIRRDGQYRIYTRGRLLSVATGKYFQSGIYKNGAVHNWGTAVDGTGTHHPLSIGVCPDTFVSGDYIENWVYNDDSVSRTLQCTNTHQEPFLYIEEVRKP